MAKRVLTDEEKALLAAAMADVQPLNSSLRKEEIINLSSVAKTRRPRLTAALPPLEKVIDLHGLTLECAYRQLSAFIAAHIQAGTRDVRVITGKSGQLAQDVPRWLTLSDMKMHVAMVSKASLRQGGEGALCVRLKQKKT